MDSTFVFHICIPYAFSLGIEYMDAIYGFNVWIPYMDSMDVCIPYMHSLYAFSIWIAYRDSICLGALAFIFQLESTY